MAEVKVVVFDLFDTLIQDIEFNFSSGLLFLYDNILSQGTDKEEFLEYANNYWRKIYDKRGEDNLEVAFEEELLDFKYKYGFKEGYTLEDIEYRCSMAMNSSKLFEDTIFTLEKLKSLGIPVYLLSNTIFKKNTMLKIIKEYDIEKFFINTYFSADYKIRKPHKDFFNVVYEEIKTQNHGINLRDVYFIGDNLEADIKGAEDFGFTPVFINRKKVNNEIKKGHEISCLKDLFSIINMDK